MTARKTTERVLKENVPKLTEYYFDIILNENELTKGFTDAACNKIIKSFEMICPKLPVYSPKILIRTPRDVLRQLRRGKITLVEAREFMAIFREEFEFTELPKMMEKLEEITQSKT